MMRIGWFTTARGPGSHNLFSTMLERIDGGDIEARLSFVFINREVKGNEYRRKIIGMAEERGIPVIIFPSDGFRPDLKAKDLEAWREAYGQGLRERISPYPMDFGVLAGYMLIIDPQTCRQHDLINLHPALPDSYRGTWEDIIGQVVDNGDDRYGSTVHVCSPELDRGAVIAYDSFAVAPYKTPHASRDDQVKAVRAEEARREAPLLMETIKMVVEGRIVLRHGEVVDGDGRKLKAYPDLSAQITEVLARGHSSSR
jgi:phosphoribosylglycinamide formyltransferase 1